MHSLRSEQKERHEKFNLEHVSGVCFMIYVIVQAKLLA